MDRARAKELIPIMQAYADGAEIEIQGANWKWERVPYPHFDPQKTYRVKPQEIWVNRQKNADAAGVAKAYPSSFDAEFAADGNEEHYEFIGKRFIAAEENDND